ncbi:hypothetical protein BH11BAC1_BH11BAC1_29930 [soil metagenome]
MKLKKFLFLILSILLAGGVASAQEIEFPLSSNPVIKEYIQKNPASQHSNMRLRQNPIVLPFEDDFSSPGVYPNPQLWMDSDAYVNQTMCDNPISIGVVTFDGINKYGDPHDSTATSTSPVICDYLTSQPIDLATDTISDSLYFSFYYQPQGMGDEPEDGDSIVLQFYAFNGVDSFWTHIWVANGRSDSAFAAVRIKIDNPIFFWDGFKFRFYNYGTPNGNRDHWNIDYVKLKKNQTYNQSLNEITLVNPIRSYLKEFSAMPYSHYKTEFSNGQNSVVDTIHDLIRVYDFGGSTTLTLRSEITDGAGGFSTTLSSSSITVNTTFTDYDTLLNIPPNVFPITPAENANYFIKHYYSGTNAGDPFYPNDTSFYVQRFHNYYAYDDGTAESATGVHIAYTKYAYQFDVKQSDSLLGMSIYFNPWGKNVHQDLFTLNLWNSIGLGTNTDVQVHVSIDNKPANNGSINGFVDYYFDTAQWVNAGTHYIGIVQSSINEIGIGVDHNTDSHDKMFLNFNNQWVQSTINGSWMMRPIFGKKLTIGINEIASKNSHFDIFPNPSNDKFIIRHSVEKAGVAIVVSIFNILGEKIISETKNVNTDMQVDVHSLPSGIYFVNLADELNSFNEVKKLIIEH